MRKYIPVDKLNDKCLLRKRKKNIGQKAQLLTTNRQIALISTKNRQITLIWTGSWYFNTYIHKSRLQNNKVIYFSEKKRLKSTKSYE